VLVEVTVQVPPRVTVVVDVQNGNRNGRSGFRSKSNISPSKGALWAARNKEGKKASHLMIGAIVRNFFFVEIAGDGVLIDELEDEDRTAANAPLLYSRLPYINQNRAILGPDDLPTLSFGLG
jgi:hypothetical protein